MCGNLEFNLHVELPHVQRTALDSRFDHDECRFDCRCPSCKSPRVLNFFPGLNQMSTPASARRPRNNNGNEPPALRHRSARGRVAVRRVANNNNMMAGLNQYGTMMPQRLVYGNNNANNNWKKPGAPRVIRTLPYSLRTRLENNISFNTFKNGNIGYLMFRRGVPVLYTAGSLYGLIKAGPHKRHINSVNNLNHFLAHVKNNSVLFKNTQTRQNRTQRNIRKVKVSASRAARTIQRKFRSTRR